MKLQQKIAGALQNLATNRENRAQISQQVCVVFYFFVFFVNFFFLKKGGVPVLIQLIRTDDQKLQKYGLGGLKRLVYNSREATLAFQKLGGLPPLIALLDSDDPSVLKNAVHAVNRVRHYIGREPVEALGGVAALGRLLTCEHDKIRALARRNLQSMDEDVHAWMLRIERVAVRLLVAARVLLGPHAFVRPSAWDVGEAAASPVEAAASATSSSSSSPGSASSPTASSSRRKLSLMRRRPAAAASKTSSSVVGAGGAGSGGAGLLVEAPPNPALANLPHMTRETNVLLTSMGYGETYWHLRPGTPHMLPVPLLQIIISFLDVDCVLSSTQKRLIFAWARDKSTLGKPVEEFLTRITNIAPCSPGPSNSDSVKKASCTIC